MRLLPNYHNCFVCGESNKTGIHASFFRDEDRVVATCTLTEQHAGYKNIVHGGLTAAVLDEALGRIVSSMTGKMVVTGELNVRFHWPIPTGTQVEVTAIMDKDQKHPHRFWTASGKVVDKESGKLYTSAWGRFFPIPEEKYEEILSTLEIPGAGRPVTIQDI